MGGRVALILRSRVAASRRMRAVGRGCHPVEPGPVHTLSCWPKWVPDSPSGFRDDKLWGLRQACLGLAFLYYANGKYMQGAK
jgi:hypothetical protein